MKPTCGHCTLTGLFSNDPLTISRSLSNGLASPFRNNGKLQMCVDGNFFSVLLDLLADHKVNCLKMTGVTCEEIREEDLKRFDYQIVPINSY